MACLYSGYFPAAFVCHVYGCENHSMIFMFNCQIVIQLLISCIHAVSHFVESLLLEFSCLCESSLHIVHALFYHFLYSIIDILNSSLYLIRAQVVVCFNHWSVFVLTFSKICWIKHHGVHFCPPKLRQDSCFGSTDGYLFCCAIERQWKSELQCSPSFLTPNQYYPGSTSSLIGIFECDTSCTHHFRTSKHSPNMFICMNCS